MGLGLLDIFRDIDHDRAGAPGLGDVKGFFHDARDLVHIGDEVAVFHDGKGDADDIGLLEGAAADHVGGDLAGQRDERAGIHVGVGDGGDEIGGAGAAGAHAHAGLAGGAGVAFGGKGTALFMPRENGADLRVRERLVDLHARAAGISENDFDAFALEGFHEDVAPEHGGADFGAGGRRF